MSLLVQVRDLVHKPGQMREQTLEQTLTQDLGTELVAIRKGQDLVLDLRLESVHEGILATASGVATAQAECARCLDPVSIPVKIEIQELFHYHPHEEDDFAVVQDVIDLEQAVIDAVVPNLPLKPLCSEECGGLCPTCGQRLEFGETHEHEAPVDPRFSALKDFGKD